MEKLIISDQCIELNQLIDAVMSAANIELSEDSAFVQKINRGADFLKDKLDEDGVIYGVTTGYGDSCDTGVSRQLAMQLPHNLYTFHGCGTGRNLSAEQTKLVLIIRLISLAKGVSGVRLKLLKQIILLLKKDILPVIPEEGSVGASGDLTPLSYLAAVLCGEREVMYRGEYSSAGEAMEAEGIEPLQLMPKEGLAIMNGTAVMSALAVEAYRRTVYLSKLCTRLTALVAIGLGSDKQHFDAFLFSVKPHQGQALVAQRIREDLNSCSALYDSGRLQERYSVRCAPHVIGVLEDILPWYKTTLENEINSANDNPIIDPDNENIFHGGHFYGGHVAFVMDGMKNNVANLADLMDRQMALLVDIKYNHGLNRNLSGMDDDEHTIHHGFKAVQIACSAWTAEALKLTMPASVFSRSTESHNQDKVSMGTIAARDCLRVLTLTEQVAAALSMATRQAVNLRVRANELKSTDLGDNLNEFLQGINEISSFLRHDRRLDGEIKALQQAIQQQQWPLYG